MRQMFGARTYATTILAISLLVVRFPGTALSASGRETDYCRNVNGRLVCHPVTGSRMTGTRSYERWPNGSPTGLAGSSSDNRPRYDDSHRLRPYSGPYNSFYGFGR